jgi:hypothetical protein
MIARVLSMILARKAILLAPVLLAGCLSLPPPAPATARSQVGDPAPVASLARTGTQAGGARAGVVSLRELWGETSLVLVFYRGYW